MLALFSDLCVVMGDQEEYFVDLFPIETGSWGKELITF